LLAVACENAWNNHPIAVINEFIRLLLSIEDGLRSERLFEVLMNQKHGVAVIFGQEK
jgi:hypothetical protein